MAWDLKQTPSSRLRAPSDGIVASQRPGGRLAENWLRLLHDFGASNPNRVARGRSLARGGRVRDLWFSPGLANAEVIQSDAHSVSLRVRVFEEREWQRVIKLLQSNLSFVASLLEGELPETLLKRMEAEGLPLMPLPGELDGDCNCGDYALPCAHLAAICTVLADALEGEPFLLLTLRGRTREQVIAALRRAWGDKAAILGTAEERDEDPPDVDWFSSPTPIPRMQFRPLEEAAASGLCELGPAPGDADLERALGPLYEAGSAAAQELALQEGPTQQRRRRAWRRHTMSSADPAVLSNPDPPEEEHAMAKKTIRRSLQTASNQAEPTETDITELLVNALASMECAKSKELSERLAVPMIEVRTELLELEKLGIVYRTGQTRGTRWWLG